MTDPTIGIPPDSPQLAEALQRLADALRQRGYLAIRQLPLRQYPASPLLEAYERTHAGEEECRVFSISSDVETHAGAVLRTGELTGLYHSFFLNKAADPGFFAPLLPDGDLAFFRETGLMQEDGQGRVRFVLRVVPLADSTVYFTSAFDRDLPFFTYLSYDSLVFAQNVRAARQRRTSSKILDYCCGSGFVGLTAGTKADLLACADMSEAALWFTRLNATLRGRTDVTCSRASEPPEKGDFDMILCNPPFVFFPEQDDSAPLDSQGGGMFGCELTMKFMQRFPGLLRDGGQLFMISRSPVIDGKDFMFQAVRETMTGIGGKYTVLAPSVTPPEDWEARLGIQSYNHVFIQGDKDGDPGRWEFAAPGDEAPRYAF